MDEETAREIDRRLREMLTRHGLGWLVEQVDGTIREELYVVKQPARGRRAAREEPVEKAADARRGEIGTRPYSPQERLEILINAVKAVLGQEPELENEIEKSLISETDRPGRVELVDEDTGETVRVISPDQPRESQLGRSAELLERLDALRPGRVGFE